MICILNVVIVTILHVSAEMLKNLSKFIINQNEQTKMCYVWMNVR